MAATEKLAMLGGRSVRTAPCRSLLKVDALTAVEAIKA